MTIESDPSNIGVVRTAVEAFGAKHGFTRDQAEKVGLAVNEALANVIEHGYQGDVHQPIEISMDVLEADGCGRPALRLVIRDFGRHVDPACIKSRNLSDVRPGGLGVHIIRSVMDDVRYRCVPEGGMELVMLKYMANVQESIP